MGGGYSTEEEERLASELFHLVQTHLMLPDIDIDYSILKYSGLDSADVLNSDSAYLVEGLVSQIPDYVTSLGSTLSSFKSVPNAVGLGALMISFLLDFTIKSLMTQSSQTLPDMMRRIFAEEKASGVRDAMDEYLKRFHFNMHKPPQLLEDTKRLEKQLSEKLTSLRNSMLHDDQMSTRSLKHWTNGAAFHLQMLIHAARLEMDISRSERNLNLHVGSISNMAGLYQNYLEKLLVKYKSFKRSTINIVSTKVVCGGVAGVAVCPTVGCGVSDSELEKRTGENGAYCNISKDTYLNYMFNNWNQIQQLKEYFIKLKNNLRQLILQNQTFNIQTVLH